MLDRTHLYTHHHINHIEEVAHKSHSRAIKSSLILPFSAVRDASYLTMSAFGAMLIWVPRNTAALINRQNYFPECHPPKVQAYRLVHALKLLAAAGVSTVTIPFAFVTGSSSAMMKGLDFFGLREPQEAKQDRWYSQAWTKTCNVYNNHSKACKIGAGVAGLAATGILGYFLLGNSPNLPSVEEMGVAVPAVKEEVIAKVQELLPQTNYAQIFNTASENVPYRHAFELPTWFFSTAIIGFASGLNLAFSRRSSSKNEGQEDLHPINQDDAENNQPLKDKGDGNFPNIINHSDSDGGGISFPNTGPAKTDTPPTDSDTWSVFEEGNLLPNLFEDTQDVKLPAEQKAPGALNDDVYKAWLEDLSFLGAESNPDVRDQIYEFSPPSNAGLGEISLNIGCSSIGTGGSSPPQGSPPVDSLDCAYDVFSQDDNFRLNNDATITLAGRARVIGDDSATEIKNEPAEENQLASSRTLSNRSVKEIKVVEYVDDEEEDESAFVASPSQGFEPSVNIEQSMMVGSTRELSKNQLSWEHAKKIAKKLGVYDGEKSSSWFFLCNYSRNTVHGEMTQNNVKKTSWSFNVSDSKQLELHTRELPEEPENYVIKIQEGDKTRRIHLSSLQQCAALVNTCLPEDLDDATRVHQLQAVLNTIWRTGGIARAKENDRHLPKDMGTSQRGPIEVEISVENDVVKVMHQINRQIFKIENNQLVDHPYFSTWTLETSIGSDNKESIAISWSPFEEKLVAESPYDSVPAEPDADPIKIIEMSKKAEETSDLAAVVGQFSQKFAYNDHELKQRKYAQSLEAVNKVLSDEGLFGDPKYNDLKFYANVEDGDDVRVCYRGFLNALRDYLKNGVKDNDPILDVVKARFKGNRMYEYCEDLITAVMQKDSPAQAAQLSFEEQFEAIDNMPADLKANLLAVEWGKFKGTFNFNFDPHLETNTPYANYSFTLNGKERANLRFGTPTWEGYWYKASTIPEYNAFIQALKAEGKKHLYINLQNQKSKLVGNERDRCMAINGLAKKFPETFFTATFDQDSSFYKQSKGHAERNNADAFKKEFEHQMFNPNSSFFFSDNLKVGENREKLLSVLDEVHKTFFENKVELAVAERQAFIEISYSLMTMRLLEISDAESYNMSCKDAIDRGGKCNSLMFYMAGLLNDLTEELNFKQEHMTVTHAPAMIVKKQAIIHSRRDRLLQALGVLANKADLAQLRSTYQVSAPEVCRREGADMLKGAISACNCAAINHQPAFPGTAMGADDPVSFYTYELTKKAHEAEGFDADIYGKFLHQDYTDIEQRQRTTFDIEGYRSEKHTLKGLFEHLLSMATNKTGSTNVDLSTLYKAVHAAISSCTQSFEAPYVELLNNKVKDFDLGIANTENKPVIAIDIKEGNIEVTCRSEYVFRSTKGLPSPDHRVEVTRSLAIPLNNPEEAFRFPATYQLVQ